MRGKGTLTKAQMIKKALAVILAGVFLLTSTLGWAQDKLAPPLGSKSETLRVRFLAGEILLSHKRYNDYIAKKIEEIGYDKLDKKLEKVKGVETEAELISIPGLLKFTGLPAHVGLGRYYGRPVIYIDSDLYHDEDIRQHEIDEVSWWEALRRLLEREPRQMREWIMQNIEIPVNDERLEGTEYYGKSTREIAKIIHKRAHELPQYLHKELAGKIDYENLAVLTMYEDEETESKKDVAIAAQKQSKKESSPASITAGDVTEGKTKKAGSPQEKRRFERISRYIRAKFRLEFGELTEDHAVTRYVRSVFEEMMGDDAKEYRVIVAPAWNQINAAALPDGTIIVSRRLLEFLEYKEELQGVLAHEVVHIRRRHAEALERLIQHVKADITVENILETVGLMRLQETEADLRWIVEELKSKGNNPFGYQIFLERFDEFKQSLGTAVSPDWIHGGLNERALNAESIFHHIDLESLSRNLTKVPPDGEFKRCLEDIRRPDKLTLWSGFPTHLDKDKIEEACQETIDLAGRIPASHIGIALKNFAAKKIGAMKVMENLDEKLREKQDELSGLKDIYEELKAARRDRARAAETRKEIAEIRSDISDVIERLEKVKIIKNGYEKLSDICINRINDEIITSAKWKDEEERRLARALYYNLYCGIQYFKETILSEEMMRRLPDIMADKRFSRLPIICLTANPSRFLNDVMEAYMKLKGIERRPTKKKVDEAVDFAASFINALEGLYKTKGSVKVSRDDLLAEAAKVVRDPLRANYPGLSEHVDDKIEVLLGKTKKIGKEAIGHRLYTEAALINSMIKQKIKFHKTFAISDYRDVLERIEMIVKRYRMDRDDIIDLFLEVVEIAKFKLGDQELVSSVKLAMSAGARYALFRLFEKTVNAFDQFRTLAPLEKKALLLNGLIGFVYRGELELGKGRDRKSILKNTYGGIHAHGYEIKVDEKTVLTLEDNKYLEIRRNSVERDWLKPERSRQDVLVLYNGLMASAIEVFYPESITHNIFIRILANYLARYNEWGRFFAEVEALEKIGVPASKIIMENKDAFGLALANIWETLPEDPSPEEARQILLATNFVESPFLRSQLQAYYYDRVWQRLDLDAKLDTLFSREQGGFFDLRRFNDFVEKEAKTERELHGALERLNSEYDSLMAEGSSHAGILTIFNSIGQDPETMQELVLALLTTGEDDLALKDLVYKKVKYYSSGYNEPTATYLSSEFSNLIDLSEKIVNGLYSMDTAAKYILLRKVLTGGRGLLSNPQHRERFLKTLVARIIDDRTEPDLREMINMTISVLGKNPDWKHLYFGLQPIILNKIAIPPERPTPWSKVPSVAEDVNYMEGQGVKDPFGTARETLITALASDHKDYPWRFEKGLVRYSENILSEKLKKMGIITPLEKAEKMSPLSFVIEAAQNTGSLGVRFLQLLPQFIPNLSTDYQDKFSRAYDAMHGQSKASAAAVLEREWHGFWNDVEGIEEWIGGGSMATVYRIRTKAGQDEVVKVLNPNLKFFLETRAGFMREVLDEMARRYGGEYEMARLVLDDVVEWIGRDADFKGFLEKDRVFRDDLKNSGFTVRGSKYSMYVPRSFAVPGREDTPYVIREEFIDARSRNLTEWNALIREGNDMKDIISLIVRNYVKQLQDGLVHSDVHVGNFRVTADKRVAILDRNFYLELNSDIKELVNNTLLNPAALFAISPEALLDRILNISTTKEIATAEREKLVHDIALFLNNIRETGSISEVGNLLVNLRQNGLKLPLEVTLIFKNLNALQQMAMRAGFTGGIIETYLYPDTRREHKGSPADCLETIKNSAELMKKALKLNKEIGIGVSDVAKLRPYHPRTVYKEFKILKSLGILVPVESLDTSAGSVSSRARSRDDKSSGFDPERSRGVEGRRGYYCFSDMMIGPDENYTKTLINAISDIRYQIGKTGEERPLHRGAIPDDKIGLVKELVKMTILHQINLMQRPAIPKGKVLWHILEEGLVSESQRASFRQRLNKASKESQAPERIWILRRGESIGQAIEKIRRDCPNALFDVALSDPKHIKRVPVLKGEDRIKMLVFHGTAGDFAQIEGIVDALRALHLPKGEVMAALLRVYSTLKGASYNGRIPPQSWLDDPRKFARAFIFNLPPATPIPIDEIPRMNERLLKLLVAA